MHFKHLNISQIVYLFIKLPRIVLKKKSDFYLWSPVMFRLYDADGNGMLDGTVSKLVYSERKTFQ